jgi:hypothetical protein
MKANFARVHRLSLFAAVGVTSLLSSTPAWACQLNISGEGRGSLYGSYPWQNQTAYYDKAFFSWNPKNRWHGVAHGCKRILGYDPQSPPSTYFFRGEDCNKSLLALIPAGEQSAEILSLGLALQSSTLWDGSPSVNRVFLENCSERPSPIPPDNPPPAQGGAGDDDCPDIAVRVHALPAQRITVRYRCD